MREKPNIRLLAAIGLAALLALGAGVVLFTRGQSSSTAAPHTIKPLHPVSKKAKRATKMTAKKPKKHAAKSPAHVGQRLESLLETHHVVVVALYAPKAAVDALARDEAEAGARLAGAGFMQVNIFSNAQTRPLLTLLGGGASQADRLLDGPAVLIFQRPKNLYLRLGGYADKDTIAQAAINASPVRVAAPVAPAVNGNWAGAANSVCNEMVNRLRALSPPSSPTGYVDFANQLLDVLRDTISKLRALNAPKAQRAQIQRMLALYGAALVKAKATLKAALRLDREKAAQLAEATQRLGDAGDAMAVKLGATACGASTSG